MRNSKGVYTHGHDESVLRSHRWRTAENSAQHLLGELRPGMSLLDVGCGPGTLTVDLARRVQPGRVVGLDADHGVVAEAITAAGEAGVPVEFAVADAYSLPAGDGEFDVVHAHQVLQHLGDPVAALSEMRRVCRPGGVVSAREADYAAFIWTPADPRLDRWLALCRELARQNGGEPDAGRHLMAWARRAGFSEIRPSASAWCFATPEERDWWGGLWADRVIRSSMAEQAADRGLATGEELAEIATAWRDWAAEPDGWFGALNGEVLCRP